MARTNGGGGSTDWGQTEIVKPLTSANEIPAFVEGLARAAFPGFYLTIEEQEERRRIYLRFLQETPFIPTVGFTAQVTAIRAGLIALVKLVGWLGIVVGPVALFGFPEQTGEIMANTIRSVGVGVTKGVVKGINPPHNGGIPNDLTPVLIFGGLIGLFILVRR